jgi:hypothetical protein
MEILHDFASEQAAPRCFTTTHWSVVLSATGQQSPQMVRAEIAQTVATPDDEDEELY